MRPLGRRAFLSACFGALAVGSARSVTAEQKPSSIWWRRDYLASRRESSDNQLPLALVFMAEDDPWCRVMDATTFRDPDVIDALNRKFVPLRIDTASTCQRFLVEGLRVRDMPATVVACHRGFLVNSHEGYLDSLMYMGFLNRSCILSGRPRVTVVAAP